MSLEVGSLSLKLPLVEFHSQTQTQEAERKVIASVANKALTTITTTTTTTANLSSSFETHADKQALEKTSFASTKEMPFPLMNEKERKEYAQKREKYLNSISTEASKQIQQWIRLLRIKNGSGALFCIYEESKCFPGGRILITPDEQIILIYNKENNGLYEKRRGGTKVFSFAMDLVNNQKYASLSLCKNRAAIVKREIKANKLTEGLEDFIRLLFVITYTSEKNGQAREKSRLFYKWGEDLIDFIEHPEEPPTSDEMMSMTDQILKIVLKAHEKGLIIGDLKLENFVRMENGRITIIDITSVCPKNETAHTTFTAEYAAPEVLEILNQIGVLRSTQMKNLSDKITAGYKEQIAQEYKKMSQLNLQQHDCWSLGVVINNIWLGAGNEIETKNLLKNYSDTHHFWKTIFPNHMKEFVKSTIASCDQNGYPEGIANLICRLLTIDPQRRVTVSEAYEIFQRIKVGNF